MQIFAITDLEADVRVAFDTKEAAEKWTESMARTTFEEDSETDDDWTEDDVTDRARSEYDIYEVWLTTVSPIVQNSIWVLAKDGRDGTEALAFNTEEEMYDHIWDECVQLWDYDSDKYEDSDEAKAAYRKEVNDDYGQAMDDGYWESMLTISIDRYDVNTPDHSGLLRDASAEIGNLLEQISQMQGMFSDEDGAIQRAVDGAEETMVRLRAAAKGGAA